MTREAMAVWLDDLVVGDSLTAPEAERAEEVAAELRKTGATCRHWASNGQWCDIQRPNGSCHCWRWEAKP